MSESFFPRLCGGTFFTLITHAMKQHGRSRDSVQGISSNITEAECFKALVRVYYPALPNLAKSTEKSNASNYKKCKNLSDGLIPFSDRFINIGFSRIIGNDYRLLLSRMDDFVRRFIDVEYYGEWLVRALIQLILEDQTIEDDVLFQIFPDGSGVTKEELLSVHTVYIQSFLLGVWSYIVHMVPDNSVGCETFLLWHPSARESGNGSRHRFVGDIGSKVSWPLSVSLCEVQRKTTVASIVDQSDQKLSQKYAGYLTVARRKYETIKTIMDEAPKKFYDFYVCNGLGLKRLRDPIPDPTVDSICAVSPYAIIVGTGGLGKSMMMRHLMLNTIDRVDFICKLPVFVNLKDYNRENLELTDFFFEQFRLLNPDADKSVFTAGLSDGAYVLLLDGLDEVNSVFRNQFDRMLSDFVDTCGGNIVIVSSRPLGGFTRFEKFYEMKLLPFSKSKALQLIDRLVFHPEEPEFKKKFRDQLDKKLFYSHREFAENPLLLTFMLMTFERFGEVATEMHAFYGEVYDLLSKRHDAQKVGFTRAYKSGLKPDRLKDIFAAFCATTYADQRYTFSRDDMVDYLSKILIKLRDESERKIPPVDIIQDLTSAVCMMFEEGQKYYFIHRSFQEYFCALSFSKQMDENLESIGMFFEERSGNQRDDKAFHMLYAMKPDQVEKYIFIPFLEKMFESCGNDYWNYVKKMHPTFYYDRGLSDGILVQSPRSFLLTFMIDKYCLREDIKNDYLPFYQNLVTDEYVEVINDDGDTELVSKDSVVFSEEYGNGEINDPEIVGWCFSVDLENVICEKEEYSELLELMENEEFAFKREFNSLKKLLVSFKEKYQDNPQNLITVI